jgi:hypothetical protein
VGEDSGTEKQFPILGMQDEGSMSDEQQAPQQMAKDEQTSLPPQQQNRSCESIWQAWA